MVGWSSVSCGFHTHKEWVGTFCGLLFTDDEKLPLISDHQLSCTVLILGHSSDVLPSVFCRELLHGFFLLSFFTFISPFCFYSLPLLLPVQPFPYLSALGVRLIWSETCIKRSSAPLRPCSWMAKTLASCCSPGGASASHNTSFSESAVRPCISSSISVQSTRTLAQTEHAPNKSLLYFYLLYFECILHSSAHY